MRIPDVELPLKRPEPVALSPCGTRSITDVCGNFGGWQPFDADEVARRYGGVEEYVVRTAEIVDGLIAEGLVLAGDRQSLLDTAARDQPRARSRVSA